MELAAEARVKEGQRGLRKDADTDIEDDEGAPDEAGDERDQVIKSKLMQSS